MRHMNLRKEEFSLTYLRAVAAVAECEVYRTNVDVNKIDAIFESKDRADYVPFLSIQAKCSARAIEHNDEIVYPLDTETYNVLRERKGNPRIPVVMTVPERPQDWLHQSEDEMAMRHCC